MIGRPAPAIGPGAPWIGAIGAGMPATASVGSVIAARNIAAVVILVDLFIRHSNDVTTRPIDPLRELFSIV
jgi:hypothetical protein